MRKANSVFILFVCLIFTAISTTYATIPLNKGSGSFVFKDSQGNPDKPITVYYYNPEESKANVPVVFVMHGVKRNGQEYRDSWVEHAKQEKFILLVPEFSEKYYPSSKQYNLGNMFSSSGEPISKSKWTYMAIEHIFDYFKEKNETKAESYNIYGHSAGAQFVHRLVLFLPDARISTAICANAGWYTMPSDDFEFPYGLKGSGVSVETLKKAFSKNLLILLGDQDTDEDHKYLRKTPDAMAQGKHRFERGKSFFLTAKREAAKLKTRLRWKAKVIKNVGHSNSKMAEAAVKFLINTKSTVDNSIKKSTNNIKVDIVVIGNQNVVDRQTRHKIQAMASRIFSIYSDTFHLEYEQDTYTKVKIFEDFKAFKTYQKEVSKTKSNSGFYSHSLKEVNVWKNKTPTKMLAAIYHESSHLILRNRISQCPKWLNEGLAEFFEKSSINGRSIMVEPQNKKDNRIKKWVKDKQIMPLKEYLELSNKEWEGMNTGEDNISSSMAWSLVYFLMSNYTGRKTIKHTLCTLEQTKLKNIPSIKIIDQMYPGGLIKLESDWHSWVPKKRKPLRL